MKKITKRITALVIAAMMLASMIPATFAADTEVEVVYDFQGKFVDGTKYADLTYDVCKNWMYADQYNSQIVDIAKNTGVRRDTGTSNIRVNANTSTTDYWIAFKLKIDTPADYSMKIKVAAFSAAPYARIDAYIFKADSVSAVKDGIKEENKLSASGLTKNSTAAELDLGTAEQLPTGKKHFEQGDYYFVFRPVTTDDTQTVSWVTLYTLTLNGIVTEPEKDEELTDAFSPESTPATDYNEPTVISITKDGSEIKSDKNADGTHNITAPETNKNNAKFLYWAKGLSSQKRILIGETNVLTNYAPDSEYAEYLIPVYADEVSGNDEYYNANGQLIPGAKQETRVSMAGYGTSTGWQKYGDTNIYVATYQLAKPEAIIEITKKGEYTLNKEGKYAYGDTVTCTAAPEDEIGNPFKCWKKNDEIVGTDSTYTFKAWEDCTVEAVYETHVPYTGEKMKIIIDSFAAGEEIGVMAEFIGLDSAVEKGIMFTDSEENTTKIAMTTKDSQFTVIADENGIYEGYAIVGNEADGYTLITDGSYEK